MSNILHCPFWVDPTVYTSMSFSSTIIPSGNLLSVGSREWGSSSLFACTDATLKIKTRVMNASMVQLDQGVKGRIRNAIPKVDISVSSYDTAWVAMVPSPSFPQYPCFPKCIDWIMENQDPDGSWGLSCRPVFLMKDALSSTLACVIALKRWNVGKEQVKMGLDFIRTNFSFCMDKRQHSPVGFNIIFPGMIEYAREVGLELPVSQEAMHAMSQMRDLELKRGSECNSDGWQAYLAYVIEGHSDILNWQEVMKYQRSNGSLFNSPSTTATALTHFWDAKGLKYLHGILNKFGNAVPTVYPSDVFTKLCIIDSLEKLGINHRFEDLMKEILDETYRRWVQNDEEIHSEIFTCAMAFRLLRMHGYDICSGVFAQLDGDKFYWSSTDGNSHNMKMVLELHRASQIKVCQTEKVLENLNSWSTNLLRQKIFHGPNNELEKFLVQEVDHALRFPYHANLERTVHKINIENCNYFDVVTLKTSFMLQNIDTQDIVRLAVEEFNACQATYQSELHFIERWVKESRLDQLKFARQKVEYCYFSAAATLFSPEMSNVRLSWAKNSILTTVIDDFFDIGGSREELLNFIQLVGRWDENYKNNCCSIQVNIIFSALYSTVNEFGEKASAIQGRNVTSHLIEIWLDLINSMMREADWLRDMIIPTLDQYLTNGYRSFALGPIILPALYLVGPKLSLDTVGNPEYHNLYKLVSTCGRLLNDIQGFEREGMEGKLNSVSLCVLHGHGAITEEDAKRNLRSIIDTNRTELLRLVLLNKGSVIPRACKDLFWKMSRILHVFYARNDGFTSPTEMMGAVSAVIYEPLKVPQLFSADFSK